MADKLGDLIHHASTAFAKKFSDGMEAGEPLYLKVASTAPSTSGSTGYGWLEEFPMLKEWVGERMLKELSSHRYSIENKTYESSIKVKRTDFEDNDYGKYAPLFQEMGKIASEYPDELVYSLLKRGFTETCFDGQFFFDTDHPVGGGKVVSNLYGTDPTTKPAWFLLDTSRTLKPIIWQERIKPALQGTNRNKDSFDMDSHAFMKDEFLYGVRARGNAGFSFWQLAAASTEELNGDNFDKVYSNMIKQRAESGSLLRIKPTLLLVPTSLRAKAHAVIKRETLEGGEDNINHNVVEVMVCPWLDD